jgi:hypothetical protein
MRLSVFNKHSGKYQVYETDLHPIPTGDVMTGLGVVPSLALLNKQNATYLGASDFAQGQIVEDPSQTGMSLGKFVCFGISLAVVYFLLQGIKKFNGE